MYTGTLLVCGGNFSHMPLLTQYWVCWESSGLQKTEPWLLLFFLNVLYLHPHTALQQNNFGTHCITKSNKTDTQYQLITPTDLQSKSTGRKAR